MNGNRSFGLYRRLSTFRHIKPYNNRCYTFHYFKEQGKCSIKIIHLSIHSCTVIFRIRCRNNVWLHYLIGTFTTISQDKIFSRAIFVLGVILFIASFFVPANKKNNIPAPKTQSIFSILFIGITTFLIEAGSAFPYFAAIGLLTTNNIPSYQWLPIIAIYNIIMVLPAILIFLGYKLFGRLINSNLVALHNKLSNSSNSALSWIMCIVGLLLIFNTLEYL